MSMIVANHGGAVEAKAPERGARALERAAPPAPGDVTVDGEADFGYLLPPTDEGAYLPDGIVDQLDTLGNLMIPERSGAPDATPDSTIPPVFTYWGQFLDHELTARTDRESALTGIEDPAPRHTGAELEANLKNARTPRFDLDSVYGGLPVGPDITPDIVTVITGLRHPSFPEKMRVGTAHGSGPLPDGLDPHRDLPRFGQAQPEVREAFKRIAEAKMSPGDFQKLVDGLDGRAMIGDMRNDENLIVAQFHLSFLRFHNRVVDYLKANDTGWFPDFQAAQALTRLHYQWLITDVYLPAICDPQVVARVRSDRARHFFDFRAAYRDRVGDPTLGNALPFEFSVAAYRFGHSMVRNTYDYNKNFGRGGGFQADAPFDQIFAFTGGGGFFGLPKLPENWIADWKRLAAIEPMDGSDGSPARLARKIDTLLAPPLGDMVNEGGDHTGDVRALFRHLARRNLRRGLSLRLPTGQALHDHLHSIGAVSGGRHEHVSSHLNGSNPALTAFLEGEGSALNTRTPLWFYLLAEAEAVGGDRLGELGSWIVAATFIGVLLDDPESALSLGFEPSHSPLKMPDGSPIESLEDWFRFALVLE